MEAVGEKRYALLMAARDSDYVKKVYDGYFIVFLNAFADEGETWDMFRVVDGVFLDMDVLHKYDGFVISGSPCDAYGNEPWVLKLCSLLQRLDSMGKKVLGICFGHQVLCRALRGKVERACGGWDLGLRKVSMVEDLPPSGFFDGLQEIPSTLTIIECHQDEKEFAEQVKLRLEIAKPDRKFWLKICKNFLKSPMNK